MERETLFYNKVKIINNAQSEKRLIKT